MVALKNPGSQTRVRDSDPEFRETECERFPNSLQKFQVTKLCHCPVVSTSQVSRGGLFTVTYT